MKQNPYNTALARAVKHATVCAATTALLTSTGIATADHNGHEFEEEHLREHKWDVHIGGYVKTDATYDLDADLGPSLAVSQIPTGSGTDSDPSFRIHSLQSRLNFSVARDNMRAFVEADFFTGDSSELVSNSRHERLRHAYFKIGDVLIGQTWSTFMDANWVLYPATVDFAGPAGATFIRQSQFRWTLGDGFDVALENPENRVRGSVDPADIDTIDPADIDSAGVRDTAPDVVVRYAQSGDVSWQVAALFQQFEVDDDASAADGESESNVGVTGGVNFKFGDGNSVSVKANVNSNRYTYYGWVNPAAVVDGSDIELVDHTAVVAALNLDWGDAVTTIAYGTVEFDDDHLVAKDIDNLNTIHINYRWSPYENVNFGVEVSRGEQELVNGDDGDATRLQFGAQYNL